MATTGPVTASPNVNVMFKRGTQSSFNNLSTYQDGCFYLTTDSHRVYMGNNLVWYKNTLGTTEINNSTITVKVTKLTSAGGNNMYIGSTTTNVGKGASNINVISATGLLGATVTASTSYNKTTGVLTVHATSTNSQNVMVRISVMKGV